MVESDLGSFDVWEDLPPDVTSMPAACGGNTACDMLGTLGKVYMRRRFVGTVPCWPTGRRTSTSPAACRWSSTSPTTASRKMGNLPRWQREEMTFVPGEYTHQSFRGVFFDNLCGNCHGAVSGHPIDVALNPDFLDAGLGRRRDHHRRDRPDRAPGSRGGIKGPPFSP